MLLNISNYPSSPYCMFRPCFGSQELLDELDGGASVDRGKGGPWESSGWGVV